ncbi:hypothetical protein BC624_1028 [Flavobacterium granuli]|uniref:Uncharacterized protein n=1 Tax=Flavobacterium granuli TaxID=280093 RepID=A0A1M5JT51_9FLAO|nr:hypothetical protein BC624_1028 [Flavobacterium granuli]SHG43698.1 hypothetical protein SAMN05443373_1028 [Flavobacterium granuli]
MIMKIDITDKLTTKERVLLLSFMFFMIMLKLI